MASSKHQDDLLDHEYDGIREYDNPTPGWWNWLFFLTFVFSIGYFIHYHLGDGVSVEEAYAMEMKQAREAAEKRALAEGEITEETIQAAMSSESAVAAGKEKFVQNCAACHGQQGEGQIGPNLTDAYWIHGDGSLMSIKDLVANGVAEKGMPAWEKQLTREELVRVVAYVGTLRGKNIPGKEPQGDKVGEMAQAE